MGMEGPEMKITRRWFLGASAGLAALGLDALANSVSANHPARLLATHASLPTPPPVVQRRGLVGSTVPMSALHTGCYYAGETQNAADAAWETAVGRTMSVTKKYNETSVFPTNLDVNNIKGYINRKVKVCISFKPAFNPTSTSDRKNLETTLALYKSSGLDAEICLWQEAGNRSNGMSPSQYQAVYRFYGPTVQKYYPLVANLNYADLTVSRFTDYAQLVTHLVDKFAIDYYYNNFGAGHLLDPAQAIADTAGLPFGIWECSTAGPSPGAPNKTAGTKYVEYLLDFMRARLMAGKTNADVIWFDGLCGVFEPNGQPEPILTPNDYRVPLYQMLWDDLSAAA
jgi:hypothetical protein